MWKWEAWEELGEQKLLENRRWWDVGAAGRQAHSGQASVGARAALSRRYWKTMHSAHVGALEGAVFVQDYS